MEKKNKIDELLKDHHDLITSLKTNRCNDPKFKLAWSLKSEDVKERINKLTEEENKEWLTLHHNWLKKQK